jgi:thiosulfate/3-mercaptopyruvate sulfurtransferase
MTFRTLPKTKLPGFTVITAMIPALLVILTLLLLPPRAVPQVLQPKVRISKVREHMLVSTEWLARHLTDSAVVILHVARARADYDAGHLPGARFLAVGQITVTRGKVSNELPQVRDLKKVFESIGVGEGTQVVLYGERQGLWAARAWFTLDYLGHGENAALLDGNIEKWRRENRSLTTDAPPIKRASFRPHVQSAALVTLPMVRDLSRQTPNPTSFTAVLVDARPPEQYRGEESASDTRRPGHIPGAVNLYWMTTLKSAENPQMLAPTELRRLFQSASIAPGRRVVTYCHSGVQGAYAYFTAKYLGYDAALYDGSFQEWSNAARTQVATGK